MFVGVYCADAAWFNFITFYFLSCKKSIGYSHFF